MAGVGSATGGAPAVPGTTAEPEPQLVIQVAGEPNQRVVPLNRARMTLGRTPFNEIVLNLPWISSEQLVFTHTSGGWRVEPGAGSSTPVSYRGVELAGPVLLTGVDYVRVTGREAGQLVTCFVVTEADAVPPPLPDGFIAFEHVPGVPVKVGRAPDNALGAGSALLEDYHAEIAHVDGAWRVTDLGSGQTILDGEPLSGSVSLVSGRINAGGLRIRLDGDRLSYRDAAAAVVSGVRRPREVPGDLVTRVQRSGGHAVAARHLRRKRRGRVLLDDISLNIRPRELVAIVGPDGPARSALLEALAGRAPLDAGAVLVDGLDQRPRAAVRHEPVGYVPHGGFVHPQLTLDEALDFAARLRLPLLTHAQRRERILEVIAVVGLEASGTDRVGALSAEAETRLGIALELLATPQLLFLDRPTAGLEPASETAIMLLLRSLADQGRTVVCVTHATKNVMLADRVAVILQEGRLAWYGPPAEGLAYFSGHRTTAPSEAREIAFEEIQAVVESGGAAEWAARFLAHPAAARYALPDALPATPAAAAPTQPAPSLWRQLRTLSARNLTLLTRDRFSLALIMLLAPLLALSDFVTTEREMFDPVSGDAERIVTTTNAMVVGALLAGALAMMREVSKDAAVLRHERRAGVASPAAYLLSKLWLAIAIACYQAAWWVGVRYLAVDMPGNSADAAGFYVTMLLLASGGMMVGMLASAVARSDGALALVLALVILPQALFSGAHLPVSDANPAARAIMALAPARWGFEALISIGGHGKAIAEDPCRAGPGEGPAISASERAAGCACTGENIIRTCDFPGLRAPALAENPNAVAIAEQRISTEYDRYGTIYSASAWPRWGALLTINAALVAALAVFLAQRARS